MNDELQHLKNLGKTSAQWLHAVGIHSANDLRRLGERYRALERKCKEKARMWAALKKVQPRQP